MSEIEKRKREWKELYKRWQSTPNILDEKIIRQYKTIYKRLINFIKLIHRKDTELLQNTKNIVNRGLKELLIYLQKELKDKY